MRYNENGDFFTADLYRLKDGVREVIVLGEKLMLDQMLFEKLRFLNIDLPELFPHDFSGNTRRIGWDDIGKIDLAVTEDAAF